MRMLIILFLLISLPARAERDTLWLTLADVVERAQELSPSAQAAKHTFLAAEWQYRYYQAGLRPSLWLTSSPCLNREVNKITQGDGTSYFVKQNQLGADLALKLSQNIGLTGGSLYVKTSLNALDELGTGTSYFSSQPLLVGYQQTLFGYNALRWDKRLEPLRYREARKNYHEAMQLVAAHAADRFFALALAQSNLEMARTNFASADTLYNIALGRFSIGSTNENELLQLEINRLNEETASMDAEVAADEAEQALRSFLAIEGEQALRLVMPDTVPDLRFNLPETLAAAMEHGSDADFYRRRTLEAESHLAQVKANAHLRADLYVQFGLSQTGQSLGQSLRRPQHQEYASVTLSLPLLDWGRGRGQVRVAQSQLDLARTEADIGMQDFRQNVEKLVMQFNTQARRVSVAARTTQQADHRCNIARRLYVLGRNTILDLNAATTEKDRARRDYIVAVQTWWKLYFTIKSITGEE